MANKIDLESKTGSLFNNSNTFAVSYDIKNNDSTALSLSAVRVVGYAWLQDDKPELHFTSGISNIGEIRTFNEVPLSGVANQNGIQELFIGQNSYLINHDTIDSNLVAPQITLIVPDGSSEIGPISITNRTDNSFTIVLTDSPVLSGFYVSWLIPNHYTSYSNIETMTGTISASFEKLSVPAIREDNKLASHKIIFNHITSAQINPGQGLFDVDVFLSYYKNFFNNSNITSWYTELTSQMSSNKTIVIEKYNGVSWVAVTEYDENGIDINTGINPSTKNTVTISANKAVYICNDDNNPINIVAADRDSLVIKSNDVTGIKRSLISFDISAIPSSAETIINSYIRLNVNASTSAFNYSLPDGTISVHRVLNSWVENEVSWTKRSNSDNWSSVGGDYSSEIARWSANSSINSTIVSGSNNDYYIDFDITEAIQYWKDNPSQNYGLLFKLTPTTNENSTDSVKFQANSYRNALPGTAPVIYVAYDDQTSTNVPYGYITTPITNSTLQSPSFNISGVASVDNSEVLSVVAQYKISTNSIYSNLGSLIKVNNVWGNSFSPLSENVYDIRLKITSIDGIVGYTSANRITYSSTAEIFINETSATGTTDINITGYVTSIANPVSGTIKYQYDNIPTSATIYKIVKDIYNTNVVWISTNNGIYRIDKSNLTNPVYKFDSSNGFVDNFSKAFYIDTNGYVWAGTSEGIDSKLYRFNSLYWNNNTNIDIRIFTRTNSNLSFLNSSLEFGEIIENNNKLYFTLLNNSKVYITSARDIGPSYDIITLPNIPTSIDKNASNVYFGTLSGINYLTSANTISSISAVNNIRTLKVDSNNNIWVSDNNKIYCITSAGITQDISAINENNFGNFDISISGNEKVFYSSKGILKYTGSDFTSATAINPSNWTSITKENSQLITNDISLGLYDGTHWIYTDKGFLNHSVSSINYSKTNSKIINSLTLTGNNFQTSWPVSDFGDLKFYIELSYSNGETISKNFDFLIVPTPQIIVNIQQNKFINYSPSTLLSAFSMNVSNVYGSYISKIYSSKTINGVYTEKVSSANASFVSYSDYFITKEQFYIKGYVEDSYGNAIYSDPYLIIVGDAAGLYNIATSSIDYSTYNPLLISGSISGDRTPSTISFFAVSGISETFIGFETSPINSFNFIWNPTLIDGITQIKTVANYDNGDVLSYYTVVPRLTNGPTISIEPLTAFYRNNTTASISATITHISGISAANARYGNLTLSNLTLSAGKWIGEYSTSSISTSAGGNYIIEVDAFSNGNYKSTSNNLITINSLPSYTLISPYYLNNNPVKISGVIQDLEGYIETRVDILSSDSNWNDLGFITSSVSDYNGNIIHTLPATTSGVKYFLIKTYDNNPLASGDYSLTRTTHYINTVSGNIVISGASTKQIGLESVYSVLSNQVLSLSANITSQLPVSANFWEIEYNGETYTKTRLISGDLGSPYTASASIQSSRILNGGVSTYVYRGIVLELIDINGNVYTSAPVKIHSSDLDGTIQITDGSLCSLTATYTGNIINSNFPKYGSPILGSSLSASILNSSDTKIVDLDIIRGDNEDFYYTSNIALSSVSGSTNLKLNLIDSNGLSAQTILNTGLITGLTLSADISVSGNILFTSGDFFVVSGDFNVSGNATAGVRTYKVVSNSDTMQEVIVGSDLIVPLTTEEGQQYTVYGEVKSNGNCDAVTRVIRILRKTDGILELYPSSCISCYCDSSNLNLYGYVGDNDIKYLGNTLSATLSDGINNIANLSASILTLSGTNYLTEYSFDWSKPTVGTSAVYITLQDAYGFSRTLKTELPKTITNGVSATLNTPNDSSIYSSTNVPFQLNVLSGSITNVRYYVNNSLIGSSNNPSNNFLFNWTATGFNGTYSVYALIQDTNGCYTQTSARNISISDGVVINIISPENNVYVGKNIDNVFKSSVVDSLNIVSSVYYNYFGNNISATKNDTYNLPISLSASTTVSAFAFATDNTSASHVINVNVVEISGVSFNIDNVTSALYNSATSISYNVSANINPVSNITSIVQLKNGLVWENLLTATKTTSSTLSAASLNHILNDGDNELRAIVYDQFGNSAISNVVSATNDYTVDSLTNPNIKLISNNPVDKISSSTITTLIEVYDYTNGVFVDSIKLTDSSVGTINNIISIVPGKKYQVEVIVNRSGSVIISASNFINRTSTLRLDNYIIKCSTGREINLTRYLPMNDQFDYYGNDSEFKQFTQFFENYLNTMYTNTDNSCSLSILEKINNLSKLHDIDSIDEKYIPYLSNMMGYDINFDKSSIGSFGGANLGLSGTELTEYKDKVLRFVVSNLPNWYSIKTTRNSMKIMLLSFGLIGDIIDLYTLDYDKEWKLNKVDQSIISDDIGSDWYPTPHMSIGINLNESNMEVVNTISLREDILNAVESIRPANVVVDSLLGYAEVSLPTPDITIKFQTTSNINVTSANQIN